MELGFSKLTLSEVLLMPRLCLDVSGGALRVHKWADSGWTNLGSRKCLPALAEIGLACSTAMPTFHLDTINLEGLYVVLCRCA